MRGLKRFLYDRRRTIGAFGLFAALNALLLALYRLPVQAALYPTLLCAVLLYRRTVRRKVAALEA